MTNTKLNQLIKRYEQARVDLRAAIDVAYPEGSAVVFVRSVGQVNPSFGTVAGSYVDSHPYVMVEGNTGKRSVKWIPLDYILSPPKKENE